MKQNKTISSKRKETTKRSKPPLKSKKAFAELFPRMSNYFETHGLLILIFLLVLISCFVFRDFILLRKIYLYKDIGSDSINATYPHEFQVAYYMQHIGFLPKWSFYQGMGQNIFPFCMPDPYYFILMLFGPGNVMYGIGYMEIAKVISAGIIFYFFLRKIRLSGYAAVVGALLYSFSGFVILGSCWTIFSTEAVYTALILYGFERLYQDNKILLFPIGICLLTINQPFDLVLTALFLIPYILFRCLNEQSFDRRKIAIVFLKVTGLGLLGVLMSSFFLFPDVVQMLESPRVGGESSYFSKLLSTSMLSFEDKLHNVTALMRFFSNDLMGTGSDFQGWYNYLEAPLFYAGLINLLLIPQLAQFLDKRGRLIHLIFLLLFLIPVVFPFFRYSYWFFTGDYYRLFSFFVAIIFLLYSMTALKFIVESNKPNLFVLAISLILLLIALLHDYYPDQDIINQDLRTSVVVFLVCYAILIALLRLKRFGSIIKLLMLILVSVELISFSNITVNNRPVINSSELSQKTGFNDYSVDAVNYLKQRDKSFFRVTKDYGSGPAMHTSINDGQIQGFYGTTSYTSFNQIHYTKFLQELKIIDAKNEFQTRWSPGLRESPFLHSFGSVKYALVKTRNSYLFNYNYDSLTRIGDVGILRNRYSLPLGFTYERFMSQREFRNLPASQKTIVLYKAFVLDDSLYGNVTGMSRFQPTDTSKNYDWTEYARDIGALKKDTLQIVEFGQNRIKGQLKVDKQKLLFFTIPYDKGWVAKIDNKKLQPMMVNIGFTGLVVGPGSHQIELSFTPRFLNLGAIISLVAIVFFVFLVIAKSVWLRRL